MSGLGRKCIHPEAIKKKEGDNQTNANREDDGDTPTEDNVYINMDDANVSDHNPIFNSSASVDEEPVITMNIYDTCNWCNLLTK